MNKKAKKESKQDLEQKCGEYLSGWQRAQADYQNLVKEFDEKRTQYTKYSNENLILEIIPILDNFKAAFSQIPEEEKESAWVIGFSFIKKQLQDFLNQNGVEEIVTTDKEFDVAEHEAVEYDKESKKKEGTVVVEKKAGYKLNGKVIQVAKVVVSGKEKKNK
jgi:molecular chaperone GrpE